MSGSLNHSPAYILANYLVDAGLTTFGGTWPVYIGKEPDTPDDCVTIYDTDGRIQGRTHYDGEMQEHYGIQVRVRSAPHRIVEGYRKCKSILQNFDTEVLRTLVVIGSSTYKIQAITRQSDVIPLGDESPSSRRYVQVANALVSLVQLPGTGSY